MRRNIRRYCLSLLVVIAVCAAGPSSAAESLDAFPAQTTPPPDCDPLTRDPLPAWPDSADSSKRLTDCAYLFSNKSDYRRAELLFESALEMATRRGDRAARATALAGLGLTRGTLGHADEAEPMLLESLNISEQLDDKDGMAEASSQLGHLSTQRGRYDEARAYHQRSFTLWQAEGSHRGMAVALNNVGASYRAVGDNAAAWDYFQKSLAELEALGDRRRSATVIDNIGRVSRTLGDYASGLELARKALAIRETLDDREGISRSLNSLSECYQAQGNYAAALDALQRSLEIRQAIGYVLSVAEAQNNIAVVYEAQGNYPQAVAYLRKALALNAAKVHSDSLSAEIYTHLGEIFSRQGLDAQAVQSLTRALRVSAASALALQAADARLALARTYMKSGRLVLAAQELEQVLAFRNTTGDRGGRAEALIEMAEIERRRGRAGRGLALATEARDMAEAMELADVRWLALTTVGRMDVALARAAEAAEAFDAAVAVVEDMRVLNGGGEESRSRFFANRLAPYQERMALALAASTPADAFYFAERSKARVLLDVIRGDRVPITKAMTDAERRHEVELRTALTSANSELRFAAQAMPRDQSRVAALQRRRDERRVAYEEFQARLYAAHPELKVSRADVPAIRAAEAQMLAGPSDAIVEFAAGPTRMHAFVITSTGVKAFTLAASALEIGRQVQRFRDQLAARDLRVSDSARRLDELVLGPMRGALSGKTALIVVPDGMLWNLPFQALQGSDGRYLIEQAAVSYAASVTVLREAMRPRTGPAPSGALIAFGNPAGGEAAAAGTGDGLHAIRGQSGSLPESGREVEQLAAIYGSSSRVYVGAEAREDRWKAEASSYRVVHLATHGVLDNASPLYSHLVLARPQGAAEDDGLLEAWEIMNTQLRADLVVLSACETARGRVAPGEGIIGLMWAVFVAGSPATLVSQWQVDSASSTALMVAFHQEWSGGPRRMSKARALRQASLRVLHTRGFSHPFYWAGFILAGDGR
ncbi:MAG: Tetratricopeptide 2 repeat protein [Acidobacteria bacterium]|nr:Tetratricopeptide 2 repeat protein [Acidobacteriota bacterium]